MSGILYLVGTPIGNLSDFSPRALETLRSVDFIAAEDTRVTLKLMNHFELRKELVSYYAHNMAVSGPRIVERLLSGESCALVTDAGMPAISDPGEDLARLCAEAGIEVLPVPGPSAFVAALAASGLPTGRFCFEGFLSTTKKTRMEHLDSLKGELRTMIFYEAPHKLLGTLRDLAAAFGEDRQVSVSRELTKLHEETIRTTLGGALAHFEEKEPRGEFVLVLRGAEPEAEPQMSPEAALERVEFYRAGGKSLKEAAKLAAADTGFSRNELYSMALKN